MVEIADRRANVERLVLLREDLLSIGRSWRELSPDQRLVLASQISRDMGCLEFCRASVHPPARANSAIGTYPAAAPRASMTPRPYARSLGRPAGRLESKPRSSDAVTSRSVPGQMAVKPSRGALVTSGLSLPSAGSPAVDGEFDFER